MKIKSGMKLKYCLGYKIIVKSLLYLRQKIMLFTLLFQESMGNTLKKNKTLVTVFKNKD